MKFCVPRIPSALVRRQDLLAQLDAAEDCPLTLVAAAPGSGKSALLVQWMEGLDAPVAWMSCDAGDDAVGFWRNLATAAGMAWPACGMAAAEFADTDQSAQLAVGLANELGALARPGVIVVDDFNLAAPAPAVMQEFIAALPPSVRLVLGSRHDPPFPLGRLRVQGRLLELRQDDLRFTNAETRQLLTGLGVDVDERGVKEIAAVTEGWPAGVHLAGLWLKGRSEADIRAAAGLLDGLAETDRGLLDFLANEIIEGQPPEIVEFLMVTAELETFDVALCDAVRGEHDSAQLVQRVRAANLFLTELDHHRGGYRYHPLFTQFLQARLRSVGSGRMPAIHRAAAAAHTDQGDLIRAVHHSMKAGDTDRALNQLESYVTESLSLEDQATGGGTVRAWLAEHGTERIADSPATILGCAIMLDGTGHGDYAQHWLRAVEARAPSLDATAQFLLHGAWSFDLLQHGDPAGAVDRARRAQAVLQDQPVNNSWVNGLPNVLIAGHMWLDDLDGAEAIVESTRVDPDRPPLVSQVRMPAFSAHIAALRGELNEAQQAAAAALVAADELGLADGNFGRAEAHLALGMVALERYELDDAEEHLERAMRIVEGGRRPPLELQVHLERALVAHARGDERSASETVEQARAVLPRATRSVTARIDQVALRLALDRGDRAIAEWIHERLPASPAADLLRARLCLMSGDRSEALASLKSLPMPRGTRRQRIEHHVLLARCIASTEPARAYHLLVEALTLGHEVGFHRTFVVEGPPLWDLLASLPAPRPIAAYPAGLLHTARSVLPGSVTPRQEGLLEPLSGRELTVLRYLASRLTSTEIAHELYLSVNTVRSHIKAIYRKLGVNSRADAVQRARNLGAA